MIYTDATADDGYMRATDLETGESVLITLSPAEEPADDE